MHAATVPIRCWVDVDAGIAPLVIALNELPGCRTFYSCSGHPDSEGDTRAYVSFGAADEAQLDWLLSVIADREGVVVEIRRVGHCILRLPLDAVVAVAHDIARHLDEGGRMTAYRQSAIDQSYKRDFTIRKGGENPPPPSYRRPPPPPPKPAWRDGR